MYRGTTRPPQLGQLGPPTRFATINLKKYGSHGRIDKAIIHHKPINDHFSYLGTPIKGWFPLTIPYRYITF